MLASSKKFYFANPRAQYLELKVEIDQATVIRIKAPHSVKMDEAHAPRVTLTLGFDRDPVFLLEN